MATLYIAEYADVRLSTPVEPALTSLLPTLGSGSDSTSNLQRAKPVEFAQPQPAQPIQVNPRAK